MVLCCTWSGCTSDEWPIDPADYAADSGSSTGEEDTVVGAVLGALTIFEPESASIHRIGEPLPLVAEVTAADGSIAPVDAVQWRADGVEYVLSTEAVGEVELPAGIYEISAEVSAENGTRLVASVGGVRVQSENSGLYAGEIALSVDVDLMGTAITAVCRGATAISIDLEGETLTADPGQCTLDLLVLSFPADFEVDAVLYGNAVSGEVTYTFAGLFSTSFQYEGTLFDDTLFSGFIGELAIPLVATAPATGTLVAAKLSPYVDEAPR